MRRLKKVAVATVASVDDIVVEEFTAFGGGIGNRLSQAGASIRFAPQDVPGLLEAIKYVSDVTRSVAEPEEEELAL